MFTCDVRPDFYSWAEPVASKEHKCCECLAPILKGETYFRAVGKWEGVVSTHRQHLLCMEACMLVRDKLNDFECIPFGTLQEWYGTYRHDFFNGRHPDEFLELVRMIVKIRRRTREAKVVL